MKGTSSYYFSSECCLQIVYRFLWIELHEDKITVYGIRSEDFLQNKSAKTLALLHESQVYYTIGIKLFF